MTLGTLFKINVAVPWNIMPTIDAHHMQLVQKAVAKMLCHKIASENGTHVVPAVRIGPL